MNTVTNIKTIISKELAAEIGLGTIPEGTAVEFRLVNAGYVDNSSESKRVVSPKHYGIPGRCQIRDPFDQDSPVKEIMNIERHRKVSIPGGGTIMEPVDTYVTFDSNGSVFCLPGEENKLWFLRLHNKNGTNPFRDTRKAIKFVEVNEKKETSIKANIYDYKALAAQIIMSIEDDEKMIEIAQRIERSFPKLYRFDIADTDKLKLSLQGVADNAPVDFLMGVKEGKSYARVLVDYAVARNQVFFDNHKDNMNWKFKRTPGDKGKHLIMKVQNEKTKLKELVDFLATDKGHEHLIELKGLNEKYYQRTR